MDKEGPLSDAQYQERLRQIRKRREQQKAADLQQLMEQPWGRRLFYSFVFEHGGLHGPSFNTGIKYEAALNTVFNEGRRALAGELLSLVLKECPNQYLAMLGEEIKNRQGALALERAAEKERTDE